MFSIFCVCLETDWRSVRGVPLLWFYDTWDMLKPVHHRELDKCKGYITITAITCIYLYLIKGYVYHHFH